jgi:hypothetical protein
MLLVLTMLLDKTTFEPIKIALILSQKEEHIEKDVVTRRREGKFFLIE